MSVKIVYQNDILDEIEPSRLDELISSNRIKKILRSDGWASVATAPMRGRRRRYEGPERRRVPGGTISQRPQYEFRKSSSEQLRPDFSARHDPVVVLNKGSIPKMSGQMDSDTIYCPACSKKCEEKEILDGSSVGITLLMRCTNDKCGKYFSATYDDRSLLESVTPIQRRELTSFVSLESLTLKAF